MAMIGSASGTWRRHGSARKSAVRARPLWASPSARMVPELKQNHLGVYDRASRERLFAAEAGALAYSPDGRWLAVRDADLKTIHLLDARTHETAARFRGHDELVSSAAFSPDSRRLA